MYHAMKTYWGSGGILHAFLTSVLDGDEWSTSRPGIFTSGKMDPRACLDKVVKKKNTCPSQGSNPGRPPRSVVIILTKLSRLKKVTY
jgi:hypothetical protein